MIKATLILLLAVGSISAAVRGDVEVDEPQNETTAVPTSTTELPTTTTALPTTEEREEEEEEEEEFLPNGECPEVDGKFPVYLSDLKNCSVFYQCAHGVPYRMVCTFPLEFNPNLKVCDFPGFSGCVTAGRRQPFRMIGRCPPNLSPGLTKLLRDSEDNTIYYECVDGEAVLRKCPEGQIFTFRRTCEPAQ